MLPPQPPATAPTPPAIPSNRITGILCARVHIKMKKNILNV